MRAICTIITRDFLPLASVLYKSLRSHGQDFTFWLLVADDEDALVPEVPGIQLCTIKDLLQTETAKAIYDKYGATNNDQLRWALKPVFVTWLLENKAAKVMFCDPDLYFVGPWEFIFEELEKADMLLSPHWNNINVFEFEDGLFSIMRNGMYNAGFFAANRAALPALKWWAGVCHYKMDRQPELGVYDDQKYLDVLPVEFPGVQVLRHRGCNLASWNIDTSKRSMVNGKLMINDVFEPVFIHFAKDTISNILNRNDALLIPFLDDYIKALAEENFDLVDKLGLSPDKWHESILYRVKHRVRLRTRIKRLFFNLAEKL